MGEYLSVPDTKKEFETGEGENVSARPGGGAGGLLALDVFVLIRLKIGQICGDGNARMAEEHGGLAHCPHQPAQQCQPIRCV